MPELPEVETVKEGLKKIIGLDNSISKLLLKRDNLRFPIPPEIPKKFKNQKIVSIERRAKYLLFYTPVGILISHLGMTGTWREQKSSTDVQLHDHVILQLGDHRNLIYRDPRRFGILDWCELDALDQNKYFHHLGPEPLKKEFSAKYLLDKCKRRSAFIKNVIMDQKVVVGVGNIYAAECLFLSKISPLRPANEISLDEFKLLVKNIRKVLKDAIKAGGSSISDFKQAEGDMGYFQHKFKVYAKEGKECSVCKTKIENIVLSGRSSFYCPKCQS